MLGPDRNNSTLPPGQRHLQLPVPLPELIPLPPHAVEPLTQELEIGQQLIPLSQKAAGAGGTAAAWNLIPPSLLQLRLGRQ